MKQFLLTLAAAAVLGGSAQAQTQLVGSKLQRNVEIAPSLKLNAPGLQQLDLKKLPFKATLAQRNARYDHSERDPKELSYQVTGQEVRLGNLGGLGLNWETLKSQLGCVGYGYAQIFTKDMLSRYAGNTITHIDFAAWMGIYQEGIAFIMDLNTGQLLFEDKIAEIATPVIDNATGMVTFQPTSVPCDYVITGKEAGLLIGWVATGKADPKDPLYKDAGFVMPMFPDNTGAGMGANMMVLTQKGELGILQDCSKWTDKNGNQTVNCAFMTIRTEGDNGLKNSDATALQVGSVRGDLNGNAQASVVIRNMGLDSLTSFDYEFTVDGQKKTGTYSFGKDYLAFYWPGQIQLPAMLDSKSGRQLGEFKITKVNTKADEYTANNDNVVPYPVITMENGYKRTPVIEEFTSITCQFCPFGFAGLKKAEEAANGDLVSIAVHDDFNAQLRKDPFVVADYAPVIKQYAQSFPECTVNRELTGHAYADIVPMTQTIMAGPCEANMVLESSKPLPIHKTIKANVTLDFLFDAPAGSYGVVYVLTEDGIKGVQQLNGLAGQYNYYKKQGLSDEKIFSALKWGADLQEIAKQGTADKDGNYWYMPTFDHTAVAISDPFGQKETSLLPAIKAGEKIKHTIELPIPERKNPALKRENLKLAALLVDQTTGIVVTGRQISLGETSGPSAIEGVEAADGIEVEAVAGAFNVKATNAKAQVYAADGKLVSSCTVNGQASLPTFGKGVYVIRVEAAGKVYTKKAAF